MPSSRTLLSLLVLTVFTAAARHAEARLGETEAQSQARYGAPQPELIAAHEKPLLEGATQTAYLFEGWRIRVAFLKGVAARLEYAHLPDASGFKKITPAEVETILAAEKGKFTWREEKARTGYKELNALKTMFEGRKWERSDHAKAALKGDLVLTVEAREVEDYEKKLAKSGGKATPAPGVPRF